MSLYGTHPLALTIEEAEELVTKLIDAGESLAQVIDEEKIAKARWQDTKETLAAAEAECVTEWELLASGGEGPLANKAKTSKAYSYALDHALNQMRTSDAEMAMLARQERTYGTAYINASIRLEQAQTRFSALRYAAELKAQILNASRL